MGKGMANIRNRADKRTPKVSWKCEASRALIKPPDDSITLDCQAKLLSGPLKKPKLRDGKVDGLHLVKRPLIQSTPTREYIIIIAAKRHN